MKNGTAAELERQERYLSSAQLPGISANAVAAKAALLGRREASLILFVQARSLQRGGLAAVVKDLLAEFPERLGSPTLRGHSGATLPAGIAAQIKREIDPHQRQSEFFRRSAALARSSRGEDEDDPQPGRPRKRVDLLRECRERAERDLPSFITSLCVNPRSEVADSDATRREVPYFSGIVAALFEYQRRCVARAHDGFVMTEVGRLVFSTLDTALVSPGRVAMIEGPAGVGKTEAVKSWCEQHSGEARRVSLSGITNKTTFFHTIAKALGIYIAAKTIADMQNRIEDVLQQTKVLLCIDEAQFLLPSAETGRGRPELLDWVYTSCANFDVPVALIATALFAAKVRKIEERAIWDAAPNERRMRPYVKLPVKVPKEDLIAVARKLLPGAKQNAIELAVGYALMSRYPLTNLADAVADAARIAERAGRGQVSFADLEAAIDTSRIPSDKAASSTFGVKRAMRVQETRDTPAAAPLRSGVVQVPFARAGILAIEKT